MATFEKISSTTLTDSSSSTISFSSIPQTYTDLCVYFSGRSLESDWATSLRCYFNDDTTGWTVCECRALGGTHAGYYVSYAQNGYVNGSQSSTDVFGTSIIYISNYTSSAYKSRWADSVAPNNSTTNQATTFSAGIWSNTAAVTKVTLYSTLGNWVSNTTATIYGIKNS